MVVVDMVREETVTETIKAVDRISRVGESAKRFPTRAANQTKREETICEGAGGKEEPANLARANLVGKAPRVRVEAVELTSRGGLR
jgi:hypothetical protein